MSNIICTCHDPRGTVNAGGCHADQHKRKPLDPALFVDKNGTRIQHGNALRYVNPNHPDREQPTHHAFIKDGDCWIHDDINGLRHARHRGRWDGSRFEIISTPK